MVDDIFIKLLTEGSALVNGDTHEPKDWVSIIAAFLQLYETSKSNTDFSRKNVLVYSIYYVYFSLYGSRTILHAHWSHDQ